MKKEPVTLIVTTGAQVTLREFARMHKCCYETIRRNIYPDGPLPRNYFGNQLVIPRDYPFQRRAAGRPKECRK